MPAPGVFRGGNTVPPKIGVYLCHCYGEIGKILDLEKLSQQAGKWRGVVASIHYPALCSADGLEIIAEDVRQGRVDRVVVGACSPAVHRDTFLRLARQVGLNEHFLERCNLREQCTRAHRDQPALAMAKARNLLKMAVGRLSPAESFEPVSSSTSRSVLVVGGGIAGLTAAENLARAGVNVTLVEKSPFLGGKVARLHRYYPRFCSPRCGLEVLMARLLATGRVTVHTLTEVTGVRGTAGNFTVGLLKQPRYVKDACTGCGACLEVCPVEVAPSAALPPGRQRAIEGPGLFPYPLNYAVNREFCRGKSCSRCVEVCPAGAIDLDQEEDRLSIGVDAIILAAGWEPYDAGRINNYGYGHLPGVITSMDMEVLARPDGPTGGQLIRPHDKKPVRRVAFIQCAGSRDKQHLAYCSGVCCAATLKQIDYVRVAAPEAGIFVFYMDIRTPGNLEELYRRAREEHGAVFIRGNPYAVEWDPVAEELVVTADDTLSGSRVAVRAELVVLATGMVPCTVSAFECLEKDTTGFITGHLPCSPMEVRRAGIYVAGCAQEPMDVSTTVKSALAAAAECLAAIQNQSVVVPPVVERHKCDRCGRCVEECPYGACSFDTDGYPAVNPLACRGCGICQGGCPLRCIYLPGFSSREMAGLIEAVDPGSMDEQPCVLAFLCANDAYPALDLAGTRGTSYGANILTVRVPCAGAVNAGWINDALLSGIDGILVVGCRTTECHYGRGISLAESRVNNLRETLQRMLVEPERVQVLTAGIEDGQSLVAAIKRFVKQLQELGPNPFKE
ncbi:FAD-dependent oxidoreductase [Desulfofundulus salinus]|uniref:FAD-dependent oxidoreductase n=1 Tax=Desulfofundulus salinus TaxID=2419843 RepID=A0A494WUS8_9FIRM|nr:FAD-dependent oxidoreductase [Desulfofundulus salinum]